ncbi:MAG TPA: prepilin-type N-terminal cleavage/methylation domain-containing protein [Methyloprofundus sp.]|uniref:PilW family protein n=1 Tax=Methyloprofundus sp. TaxID=2020875 RepID=UPI0017CA7416|nr:PilW family protein [Methyloprofundus sp.]HIG65419.1 prepilin-type N-terminal cleavage/methylation domain-containing protein [Methyloprofundus sp.]HIL78236.1 prepilin-type N-terminal cleavage/methylation domain-containing protein [Methylococcales bacterium]
MKSILRVKKQRGMSLIEIMIALLLGAFLTGGVIQIFLSSSQTYRIQDALAGLQENGRFSMDFIARDMRMVDFWGCIKSAQIESKLKPNATYDGYTAGLAGINNDTAVNDILDGTDSFILRGAMASNVFLVSQPTTVAANIKVTSGSGLLDDDIVLLSDCRSGDIFQITNLNSGAAFDLAVHNTGGSMNASKKLEVGLEAPNNDIRYGTDAQIYKLAFITYSIQAGANGQPSLFKRINNADAEELVEGVEDMQILYGEDSDDDALANYYVDADTVVEWGRVVSVRISLLLQTLKDNIASKPLQYSYNGATPTATDRRLRRVYTTTIALRNRL